MLSKNSECNELGLKCAEKDIPYYIAKHNFERTDFVKWLEECSSWINDKAIPHLMKSLNIGKS